jgi:hypothetical protein
MRSRKTGGLLLYVLVILGFWLLLCLYVPVSLVHGGLTGIKCRYARVLDRVYEWTL